MYTPARTAPPSPYPHWHKICETLPLLAQFGSESIPLLAQIHKKGTLFGTNLVFKTLPLGLVAHCLKTLPSVALNRTLCGTEISQKLMVA